MTSKTYSQKFESVRHLPLKPTLSHICVRILPQEQKATSSGIILETNPDRKDLNVAIVIACGPLCTVTEPGMLITMSPVATSYSVWHEGEQLGILKEEQIFGVYDDPEGVFSEENWKTFGRDEAARKMSSNGYVM